MYRYPAILLCSQPNPAQLQYLSLLFYNKIKNKHIWKPDIRFFWHDQKNDQEIFSKPTLSIVFCIFTPTCSHTVYLTISLIILAKM